MKKLILLAIITTVFVACKDKEKQSVTTENQIDVKQNMDKDSDWVYLFDGTSIKGWHIYNNSNGVNPWTIEDGTLFFPGRESGSTTEYNLVTDNDYKDFKLSLEWKISEAGNSGIMWGVIEDVKFEHPYNTGAEIQILDNERHPDAKANPKFHQAGALYDMVQPTQDVCKPAGEWNLCEIEIDHKTNKGSVTLNGTEIVTFPLKGEAWDALIANSKFKDWKDFGVSETGKICLQDHENRVWFKNIKIKNL